ncbi:hypothetical protein [uncultured Brachyspira sp.]|uniref:hypothetical protein n=1 Tax=uncultured Brachyspira sp. TaxID=221953 RepID=UPI00258FB963|nr:hypothetical protein [uncultured Brachyspira sp.]
MYVNSIRKEKRLLNFAIKHREIMDKEDFESIINLCYGRIIEKNLNNSIDRMIMPAYNKIIMSILNNYAEK